MAGNAQISSSFVISYTGTNTSASAITVGRSFRVVGVQAINETGGSLNVTVAGGTVGSTTNITQGGALACAANTAKLLELDEANCEITSAQELFITVSGTGVVVKVICVASSGGQSLTVV